MKFKTFMAAFFCLLLAAFAVSAQQKSDYSGAWTLDLGKSKLSGRMPIESMTMNVSQGETEITVETKTVRGERPEGTGGGMRPGGGIRGGLPGGDGTFTYSLDDKEKDSGGVKIKSKLEKDGKLKLTQTRELEGPMGSISIKTRETWQLLDEGKTLKVMREMETPRGAQSSELVFTKN